MNNQLDLAGNGMATKQHGIDRRSSRTRTMLRHTLLSLIRKKSYEAITIKDICDAANVGRSTFYAHYTSKDDLKRSGLEDLRKLLLDRQRDALATRGNAGDRSFAFSLTMFEHARDHRDLYRALVGSRGGDVALGSIRQTLCDLVRNEFAVTAKRHSADMILREPSVQYVVGAYMSLLTWWLDGGAKLPPHQIDAIFRRLATEGVTSASRACE